MKKNLKLGTRGSALALAQAELAKAAIENACLDYSVEICIVRTSGDKDRVRSLVSLGGTGVFVKELEELLLAGEIDFAVHSLKDVPVEMDSRLMLASFLPRALPYDVLVSNGIAFKDLPQGARIGTGSPRRVLQLKKIRPDIECVDLRGNLGTRIEKVTAGELNAILLGGAGLVRLGWKEHISEQFSPEVLTPAIGQGIVALQCAEANGEVRTVLEKVCDKEAAFAARTERSWMKYLGGGCRVPMAAFLEPCKDGFRFYAYLSTPTGDSYYRAVQAFKPGDGEADVLGAFGENFVAECQKRNIPLPREVDEHALLNFWGKL